MKTRTVASVLAAGIIAATLPLGSASAATTTPRESVVLFNGKDLDGWNGDAKWFRVEDGAIVAGSLKVAAIPHNYFLATNETYHDFELTLKVKLRPAAPGNPINGGIQFRSVRVDGSTEMAGYQADIGTDVWGGIYDESRRRRFLTPTPTPEEIAALIIADGWNDYRIVCKGARFTTYVNGVKLADYLELDPTIAAARGHIALQIHSAKFPQEILYKDLRLKRLD